MEQHFKNKLQSYQPEPWDKEGLWADIEAALPPEKKKRRGIIFWLFLGSGLIGVLAGAWLTYSFFHPDSPNLPDLSNETQVYLENHKEIYPPTEKPKTQLEKNETAANKFTVQETKPSILQNDINHTIFEKNKNGKTNKNPNNQTIVEPVLEAETTIRPIELKITKNQQLQPIAIDSEIIINNKQEKELSSPSWSPPSVVHSSENDLHPSKDTFFQTSKNQWITLNTLTPENLQLQTQNSSLETETIFKNLSITPINDPTALSKNQEQKIHLFAAIDMGIGSVQRQFINKNPNPNPFISPRETSEKPLEVWSGSAYFGAKHTSGWFAKTGFSYQQLTELFSYENTTSEDFTAYSDTAYVVEHAASEVYYADSVRATATTYRRVKHYNRQTFYEVPIWLGFEKNFNKWVLGLQTGLSVNVAYRFNGKILDGNDSVYDSENPTATNLFKSRLGLSWLGAAHLGYQLHPKWRIQIAGQYQWQPTSVIRDVRAYEQQYHFFNLKLGVQKAF